jgi:hypothetical protein
MAATPGYFTRYKEKLTPLIGVDAATVVVSYYKWTLAGFTFMVLGFPVVASGWAASTPGALVIVALLALTCSCAVRCVRLTSRGGKLVSAYLTKEWGQPVRFPGVKVSMRWWRWRLEQERRRLQDETID